MADLPDLAPDLVPLLLVLAAVAAARWLLGDLRGVPRGVPHDGAARTVSVVVPARDEADTLPLLLASLGRLAVPVREVVVVDDGSADATAAVGRAAGARVLPAGARPPGWTGKAWACHVGARAASGDLLLFLDADTVLAADAVDGLLALRGGAPGLVSVQPFHAAERPYEQLSAYFNAVALLASGAFTRRPAGRPMAFGPCLLTSRSDHARAGGHAAVRSSILDDADLAAAYHRVGLPVRCAVGGRSVRMRSYPGGPRQLVDGWTKNIASGASTASPGPALATVLWVCTHHAIAVGMLLSVAADVTGRGAALAFGTPALWVTAWVLVAGHLRAVLGRAGSFRWWTWALFPLPLLAFDAVFVRSAARTVVRRSVRWRGREVDLRGTRGNGSVREGA
jgi:4,4'-diaponeurosporenoate glycosyltransferase